VYGHAKVKIPPVANAAGGIFYFTSQALRINTLHERQIQRLLPIRWGG